MSHVELPRPLEAYFAHAELDGSPEQRRFTITLPYFDGPRLDRLQWWWSVTHAQQRMGGIEGLEPLRRTAVLRFRQHIEHWLATHRLQLVGDDPIPRLESWAGPGSMADANAAGGGASEAGVPLPQQARA